MSTQTRVRDVKTIGDGRVLLHGRFRPNGATGIVTDSESGKGWSVARTGVGVYRVTLDDVFPDQVGLHASVRSAAGAASLATIGDYVKASKYFDINVFQGLSPGGGASGLQKTVQLVTPNGLVLDGSNPPTLNNTGYSWGYAFDADAEQAGLSFRIPDDWDGASDLNLIVVWHPESGTALADTETVIWECSYYAGQEGEAVDAGTAVDATGTETQSGAGTDKNQYRTPVVLDYDAAAQPLTAGDHVFARISRDMTGDTYAADAVLCGVLLQYEAAGGSMFAPADLAADADNEVSFLAMMRNTSVPY